MEELRISSGGFSCLFPVTVLFKSILGFWYDNQLHKATSVFVGNLVFCDSTLYSPLLHECIWPYLIGWGLAQWRCVSSLGLSAVCTQIMHHLILCVQGQLQCRNKRFAEHLVGTKSFSRRIGPMCLGRTRQDIAQLTWHPILRCLILLGFIYLFLRIYRKSINPNLEMFVHFLLWMASA